VRLSKPGQRSWLEMVLLPSPALTLELVAAALQLNPWMMVHGISEPEYCWAVCRGSTGPAHCQALPGLPSGKPAEPAQCSVSWAWALLIYCDLHALKNVC
jgi:hypothetical protein